MAEQDTMLRWLGYASHDVANPVTALRLLAELALGAAEGSVREDLEDIMAEADYATVLLDSMGRVATRMREQDPEHPTWFEVDLLEVLRRASGRPAFRDVVTLEVADGLNSAVILGDDRNLEEAFHDVYANARRLGSGRSIHVRLEENEGAFEVTVDHPAPGLTAEQCEWLLATDTVLALRDDNVPVAAGGWVNAAEVFAMHDGTLRFEELSTGVLRLHVRFTGGLLIAPRDEGSPDAR
jgi:light-regulated signal transduction histidine kinase (bacteriophytochrome)